jgi:K+-sensing histidine kinase KdpD
MAGSQQSDQAETLTPRASAALPYTLAILGVLIATVITRSVPVLHKNASTAIYFVVVIFASYKGGFRPAMLAVVLSAALWALFIIPPDYSFIMQSSGDVVRLLIFIFIAVLNSSLFEQLAKARRDVRKQQARLDLALEAGRMGVWDYDLIQDDFWISPEIREIFGVGDGEFSPTYGGFLAFVHPEDRALVVLA